MLQSAGLAEVVATPGGGEEGRGSERAGGVVRTPLRSGRDSLGDDGALEGVPAYEALEGQVLFVAAHLVVLAVWRKQEVISNHGGGHRYTDRTLDVSRALFCQMVAILLESVGPSITSFLWCRYLNLYQTPFQIGFQTVWFRNIRDKVTKPRT